MNYEVSDDLRNAALEAGVPLYIAAAMIEKESNGHNVYGNDRGGVYSVGDPARPVPNVVTRDNFRAFEARVLAGETSNGVGPAQITWPGFIRDAKNRGIRLWEPYPNMVYGFTLLRDYLAGDYSDDSIRYAGKRYNGAAAYGDDLLVKARRWQSRLEDTNMTLLTFPARNQMHTQAFWNRLEDVYRQMGYDVYCAPSYVRAGYCAPGKHPHGRNSRHFAGRALDIGFDPPNGAPESDYEKSFLDVTVRMMQVRYPNMLVVWNRGPGDHRDHAHFDDVRSPMEGSYTGIRLPNGIIGFGMSGAGVERMQRNLNKNGAGLVTDGIFGLGTYDALRRYQYAKGLLPDGLHGPATEKTFYPPNPDPKPTPPPLRERVEPLRLFGDNRYATAAALDAFTPPNGKGVILAVSGSPDYQAAVAITGRNPNIHVLPLRGASNSVPGPIAGRIRAIKPTWIRVAGGRTVVSDRTVEDAAKIAGIRI